MKTVSMLVKQNGEAVLGNPPLNRMVNYLKGDSSWDRQAGDNTAIALKMSWNKLCHPEELLQPSY